MAGFVHVCGASPDMAESPARLVGTHCTTMICIIDFFDQKMT